MRGHGHVLTYRQYPLHEHHHTMSILINLLSQNPVSLRLVHMLTFLSFFVCFSFLGHLVQITLQNATTGVCWCILPQMCGPECIANAIWWHRRRIYYACMGKIVNSVTEVHLKHAYSPRIGSRIDLLKDLLFCKTLLWRVTELRKTESM